MKINRVESLVYGVSDMEVGVRYFQDWGLQLKSKSADRAERGDATDNVGGQETADNLDGTEVETDSATG